MTLFNQVSLMSSNAGIISCNEKKHIRLKMFNVIYGILNDE